MHFSTFKELQAFLLKLFRNGDYAAVQDLLASQAGNFPEQQPLISYYQISASALAGNSQEALSGLKALLDSGFWYNDVLLRKSKPFASLQNLPEFEALVERNRQNQAEEQAHRFPMLVLRSQGRCQAGSSACPLLLGLHANASTAQASLDYWRAAASAGWLVAALQSSQPMWRDAYGWDDPEYAEQEVKKHMANLNRQYAIDTGQVVLAGHEMGGEIAIQLSLKNAIAVRGFIAIAPSGATIEAPENWESLLQESPQADLRGYIIIGKEDQSISRTGIHSLMKVLVKHGIPSKLEEVPDAGSAFTSEFSASLLRGLDFIRQA